MNILLVEDDAKMLYAMRSILEIRGHQVVACASAEEAMDYKHDAFNVAIVDVRLPEQQGPAFAQKLSEKHPELKVILVTAYNDVQSIRRVMPRIPILVKPVSMDDLTALF